MLEDDDRETMYRDYTATMQRHLVNMLHKKWFEGDWEPPSYIEMAHPSEQPKPQETAADAKAHIYQVFGIKENPERG